MRRLSRARAADQLEPQLDQREIRLATVARSEPHRNDVLLALPDVLAEASRERRDLIFDRPSAPRSLTQSASVMLSQRS